MFQSQWAVTQTAFFAAESGPGGSESFTSMPVVPIDRVTPGTDEPTFKWKEIGWLPHIMVSGTGWEWLGFPFFCSLF